MPDKASPPVPAPASPPSAKPAAPPLPTPTPAEEDKAIQHWRSMVKNLSAEPKLETNEICIKHIGAKFMAALAKAQGEFPTIEKDRTVTVKMRNGGSYKFTYATLDSIIKAIREPLAKNGLSFMQNARPTDESARPNYTLDTYVFHSSGEYVIFETGMFISGAENLNQALGSAVTYAQRRAVRTAFGVATEEDDDGNIADGNQYEPQNNQPHNGQRQSPKPRPPRPRPAAAKPKPKPNGQSQSGPPGPAPPPPDEPPSAPSPPADGPPPPAEPSPPAAQAAPSDAFGISVEKADEIMAAFSENSYTAEAAFKLVKKVSGIDPPPNEDGKMGRAHWRQYLQRLGGGQAEKVIEHAKANPQT